MKALVEDLTAFGARLRDEGVAVDAARLTAFADGIAQLGYREAYWVGAATLLGSVADRPAFDRAFRAHFDQRHAAAAGIEEVQELAVPAAAPTVEPDPSSEEEDEVGTVAGRAERLRDKRFDAYTDEELSAVDDLLRRFMEALLKRPTRRHDRDRRGRPDPRRTIRRTLREGDPQRLDRRRPRRQRRRLVILLDVSGSMSSFTRPLLAFAHAAMATAPDCETFCFGTHLTRITEALRAGGIDSAIDVVSEAVTDWDGGTRIGEALEQLLDTWGRQAAVRGSVVLVCSDGLETGDPDLLAAQMARLRRISHRIFWLNHHKGIEGYVPLTRGMTAALPFVDRFAAGDTLADLASFAGSIGEATERRS